jgi:hypothetical protein
MSYLSLFTFFMLVYVCGDNLIVMLVGLEFSPSGNHIYIVKSCFFLCKRVYNNKNQNFKNEYHTKGTSSLKRIGPHPELMNDIMTGGLLGDGSLQKGSRGCCFNITLISKFKDVAEFYLSSLYKMGYTTKSELGEPRIYRTVSRPNNQPTYRVESYSFSSFNYYFNE